MGVIDFVTALGSFVIDFLGAFITTEYFVLPVFASAFFVCVILPFRRDLLK